jgi:2-C-methyl-D-erythritol 2,4-cyclodiphosphate synthase
MDAMLGAAALKDIGHQFPDTDVRFKGADAALKDIGHQFPDTDVRFKGADSAKLLAEVRTMVEAEGLRVGNVDCVVIVERPRLAKYVDRMRARVAEFLGVGVAAVGVKAKTNEGFGYIGEGEAIAAWATVLLVPFEE